MHPVTPSNSPGATDPVIDLRPAPGQPYGADPDSVRHRLEEQRSSLEREAARLEDRRVALVSTRDRLAAVAADFERRELDLTQRRARIEADERAVDLQAEQQRQRAAALTAEQARLDGHQVALDDQRRHLDDYGGRLSDDRRSYEDQRNGLVTGLAEVARLDEQLRAKRDEYTATASAWSAAEAELRARQHSQTEWRRQIDVEEARLRELDAALALRQGEVESATREFGAARTELAGLLDALQMFSGQASVLMAMLDERTVAFRSSIPASLVPPPPVPAT